MRLTGNQAEKGKNEESSFHARDFTGCVFVLASDTSETAGRASQFAEKKRRETVAASCILRTANCKLEGIMDDIEKNTDGEFEDDDEQIEQMIIENGILLHSLATLLVRKGILKQEEIDAEMDRLYDEMENFEQQ